MCRTLFAVKIVGIGYTTSMAVQEIRVLNRGMRQTDVHMGREAMSRYIDADALKENCYKQMDELMESTSEHLSAEALSLLCGFTLIDSAPSIDIVRCRECKHNYNTAINHGKMQPRCDFADWKLTESDFCSRGEREGE